LKGANDDKSSQKKTSNIDASGKDDLSDIGNQDIGDINIDIDASEAKDKKSEKSEKKQDTAEKRYEQTVEEMK
jgi:hypothetical protein